MARAPFQVLVLPWRRHGASLEVAVFHRADHQLWQFVSGGGELAEPPLEAARREGHEEAGIPRDASYLALTSMTMLPACWFAAWPAWPADVLMIPEYAFAVEIGELPLTLSAEHLELRWCAMPDAMGLVRFDSNRHALWELHERVFPGGRIKRTAYR